MKRLLLIILPLLLIVGCGKKDGVHTEYYDDAKKLKKSETTYKDGKKNGLLTVWYYDNGQKYYERTYKDGEFDGLWTEWYKDGKKKFERTYKNGKYDGLWTTWWDDGQKEYEGTYKDEIKDGLWTYWHSPFVTANYETRKERIKIDQKWKEGTYKGVDEWGNPKEVGLWTYWYENGQKEFEGRTYKDGNPNGLSTTWYEDGQKRTEETDKDGKLDGLYTRWYENGQKWEEGTYKDGERDGLFTWWDENGQKSSEKTYKDGFCLTCPPKSKGGSSLTICDCDGNYGSLSTSQKRRCDKMTDGLSTSEIQTLLLLNNCKN